MRERKIPAAQAIAVVGAEAQGNSRILDENVGVVVGPIGLFGHGAHETHGVRKAAKGENTHDLVPFALPKRGFLQFGGDFPLTQGLNRHNVPPPQGVFVLQKNLNLPSMQGESRVLLRGAAVFH
jgi:hypothetical protein